MSYLSRLRKNVGYVAKMPVCSTCAHFRRPGALRNSLPVPAPPMCKRHEFIVKPCGSCDYWRERTQ